MLGQGERSAGSDGESFGPCCRNSSMKAADCALALLKPADAARCPATLRDTLVTLA